MAKRLNLANSRWHLGGWAFWSIAALFYAYEFTHRVAPSVLTFHLREAFNVNSYQLAAIGAMYFYAYAAFQLPAGILIDRYGAKRILVFASAILTVGSFLFSTTTSANVAYVSRLMIGTGSAFAFVGCLKIGAQWLSMNSFPLVVGLTNLCGTLGALLGGQPLAHLVEHFGWREAMMQISFAGLLITLLLWLFLEEKKIPSQDNIKESPKLLTGFTQVIKNPQSWLIAVYGALLVAPIAALPEMWGVEYLKIGYQISSTQAAGLTHTIFIGTAVGGPLIGWLMISLREKEIPFMRLATLGAFILLTCFIYWDNMPLFLLYATLFGYGVLTANMLLCFALMTEQFPDSSQGAAIGFTNMIIMAMGGLSQHLIGAFLDILRSQHDGVAHLQDYHIALSVLPLCLLVAICLTFFLKKSIIKPNNR